MTKPGAVLLAAAILLHSGVATAGERPCRPDLVAVGGYLRSARNDGTVVGTPTHGQRVFLHLDYEVVGAGQAPRANLVAFLDGVPLCESFMHEFELGFRGAVACEVPWHATEGAHTLRWEIDPGHRVAETDESNNIVEVTFEVGRSPNTDIDIRRVYLRTELNGGREVRQPDPHQQTYIHVDYRVTGSERPVQAEMVAFADGRVLCSGVLTFETSGPSTLGCGEPWPATPGVHSLGALVDGLDELREASEDNNLAFQQIEVRAPDRIDFRAVRGYLRTAAFGGGEEIDAPGCGETVYLHFDYHLQGTTEAVGAPFNLLIDGEVQCVGPAPLPGGFDNFVTCFNGWIASPGSHTLRLELDPMNDVRETDEGNNTVELVFEVIGPARCAGDCDGDGTVGIAELISAVNIALGQQPLDDCPSLDADGDGAVSIGELIEAVNNALNGCPV